MTVEIADEKVVAEINRLAAGLALTPEEIVRRAVLEKGERERQTATRSTPDEMRTAFRELQSLYAAHHDPGDRRTADEIIGYNEHGLFD
jgi:hypothetical protein